MYSSVMETGYEHRESNGGTLYQEVAGKVRTLISDGVFRPGDRIPSVRQLSRQLRVSVTTVVDAYRLLEDVGIVHARPQSGFYVRAAAPATLPEPRMSQPEMDPSCFDAEDIILRMRRDGENPRNVQLCAAQPGEEYLPLERLSQAMIHVARANRTRGATYGSVAGSKALREQIAQRAFAAGCVMSPSEIVVTAGCQEALNLSLRAVCQPGDSVAIESPAYYGMLQALKVMGLRAVEVATSSREGICLDALEDRIRAAQACGRPIRACILSPNYSNPLGSEMPDAKKRKLVAMLAEWKIPLIEDDVYGDLTFADARPKLARAYDKTGGVIVCSSFSKTLAPGYRVGWVAGGRYQNDIERIKFASTVCSVTLTQLAISEFLAGGGYDHNLKRARRAYAENVRRMSEAIGQHFPEGTRVSRPQGGFVLWVELDPKMDTLKLYGKASAHGVTFAPGVIFSAQEAYKNCLRLNASRWNEKIEAAVATLGKLVAMETAHRSKLTPVTARAKAAEPA
jgi:DNA-binding transcriptional MocR family regulator